MTKTESALRRATRIPGRGCREATAAFVLFLLLVATCAGLPGATDPFLGKWKLDLAKSKLTGQTIQIREVPGNGYEFQEDEHSDVIFADGLDHLTHFGDTMSILQKKKDLWAITYKQEGRVLMSTVWRVSRGGGQLIYTAEGTRPNGQHFHNELTAKRIGSGSGLAGVWETTGVNLSSPREIYIEPFGQSGHKITFPGRKQTIRMNFDGKDYAEEGPTVLEGSTSAGRRIDERTVETTEKIKGRVIEVATASISPDGQTQTIKIVEPGDSSPVILVYEREKI